MIKFFPFHHVLLLSVFGAGWGLCVVDTIHAQSTTSRPNRACSDPVGSSGLPKLQARSASAVLRFEQTVNIPQSGRDAVLGIRSLDVSSNGTVLLVDSRQRQVSLRTPRLELKSIVGREGRGPGEYQIPAHGWFSATGDIWLLDMSLARLNVYSDIGKYKKTITGIPLDSRVGFELTDSTFLLVGASRTSRGNHIASAFKYSGQPLWTSVSLDPRLLELDLIVDQAWGAKLADGSVVVGMSAIPDIVQVDVETGVVLCRSQIPSSQWRQLMAKDRPRTGSLSAHSRWIDAASSIRAAVALPGNGLLVETIGVQANGTTVRTWTLFDSRLRPRIVVDSAPGYILRSRRDTLLVVDEGKSGSLTMHRLILSLPQDWGSR